MLDKDKQLEDSNEPLTHSDDPFDTKRTVTLASKEAPIDSNQHRSKHVALHNHLNNMLDNVCPRQKFSLFTCYSSLLSV